MKKFKNCFCIFSLCFKLLLILDEIEFDFVLEKERFFDIVDGNCVKLDIMENDFNGVDGIVCLLKVVFEEEINF